MPDHQYSLVLIPHTIQGKIVEQRSKDGYINATAMCKAAGKLFGHYATNKSTYDFLVALSVDIGIPISGLVQANKGGTPDKQGTWVHPQVAVHLAQWLSPQFAVKVSAWVYEWVSGLGVPAKAELPFHLRRYIKNMNNVPKGHFSVLTEVTLMLVAPLEAHGYTLLEAMWPDISQGKMFAKWLRDAKGIDTDKMPTYFHAFEDDRPPVPAKAYPNTLLGEFREHFLDVWLPTRAKEYFQQRDPKALPHLDKLLLPSPKPTKKIA